MPELITLADDGDDWIQAAQLAASAPELKGALAGILDACCARTGASGAAVIQLPGRAVLCARGCEAEEVAEFLAEPSAAARELEKIAEWGDAPLTLARSGEQPHLPEGSELVLLAAIRTHAEELGVLALFFPDATPPPAAAPAAQGYAALLSLRLEQERLARVAERTAHKRQDFLSALNHELRTPATALILDSFVVRSGAYGELPNPLRKGLEQIESHVEWLVSVLEGVLDLGERQQEVGREYGEVFQPRLAVLDLLKRVEPAAARKELPILFYAPRVLPLLQTDQAAFSRVVLHLLSNAIKYTEEGRIEVRMELGSRPILRKRQEQMLLIRVTDTGRGIPADELERIFEPFAQVGDGARSDSHVRGAGLGLAVARHLARSLRGEVRIDSILGTGTTATFLIPFTR